MKKIILLFGLLLATSFLFANERIYHRNICVINMKDGNHEESIIIGDGKVTINGKVVYKSELLKVACESIKYTSIYQLKPEAITATEFQYNFTDEKKK